MSINIGTNIISTTGFTPNSEIVDPNIVTDGLVIWLDAGNNSSYLKTGKYYNCGYGCQYYASDPGCTNCNTRIMDMSGNGNDGQINGSIAVTYSDSGGVIGFDGSSAYLRIPFNAASMDFSQAQTICMWLKPATGEDSSRRNPYNQAYGGPGTITHELDHTFSYYFGTNGENGDPYVGVGSGFSVAPNELAFIAFTRHQASDICRSYKDGVRYNATNAGGFTSGTANGSSDIFIGNGYTNLYIGDISEIIVYNKFMTDDQIMQNYLASRPRYFAIIPPTPSVTPTISVTPSITPSISPSKTPSASVTPSPTKSPVVSPTPTPSCARPGGLTQYTWWYAKDMINFYESLSAACAALQLWGTGGYNGQGNFMASLTVGQNVYNGAGTSCVLFSGDGYYLVQLSSSFDIPTMTHLVNGVIADFPICPSVTPTPTPSITLTPSITPTISITPTPSITSSPSVVSMNIGNPTSTFGVMNITDLKVNGFTVSPSPSFPYTNGASGTAVSPQPSGTYTVTVTVNGSNTEPVNVYIIDSNGINSCQSIDGPGDFVFIGIVMNTSQTVYVVLADGNCF